MCVRSESLWRRLSGPGSGGQVSSILVRVTCHLTSKVILQGVLIGAFKCIQKACTKSVKYLPIGAYHDKLINMGS